MFSAGFLQEAIRLGRAAADITPKDHPDRAERLNSLANGLHSRYRRTGAIDDLQEAIRIGQAVVDATPEDHLERVGRLNLFRMGLRD